MKKRKTELRLNKLMVSKLNNPSMIEGGNMIEGDNSKIIIVCTDPTKPVPSIDNDNAICETGIVC